MSKKGTLSADTQCPDPTKRDVKQSRSSALTDNKARMMFYCTESELGSEWLTHLTKRGVQ